MPQPLRVDSAQLRLSAARLDAVNSETSTQLMANARGMTSCQVAWAGSAHTAFEQLRDTWETADASRTRRLEDIATNLHQSANLYDDADQASGDTIDQTL